MSDNADIIAQAVVKALDDARHISPAEHQEHHKYLSGKMERDKRWAEVLNQVRLHLMKYGALAVVTAFFVAVWQYFKLQMHN